MNTLETFIKGIWPDLYYMRLALIGDVHGEFDQLVEIVDQIDADRCIQVGDMGTFLSEEEMDKSSQMFGFNPSFKKHYEKK